MLNFFRKWRAEPETSAGEDDVGLADTARGIRQWRRRRWLPPSSAEDAVECGIVSRMRHQIESATREFVEFVRPGVAGVRAAGDVSWVNVQTTFWLDSMDLLVQRSTRRFVDLRGKIEDVEVTQALVEKSRGILVPMADARHLHRWRLKICLGGMVGLESLLTAAALRAIGVEGGLSSTWPIAIATGATLVVLGAACGGVIWPRLKRPGIAAWGRWMVVISTTIPAAVALYVAVAMGIVRSTGSFEIEAILKIILAPSPKDIGSIALTILNCGFFLSAFWMTYRAKRKEDETYDTVVALRSLLEGSREEDVGKTQDLLMGIPMAAAAAYAVQRQERLAELASAQQAACGIDHAWNTVTELANREIERAEGDISHHRDAVITIWRPEWGCALSTFYYEQPNLRRIVAPVLDTAAAKVDEIRDRLAEIEAADAGIDSAITAALAAIQAAMREGIAKLDEAAYGTLAASRSSSPASAPPNSTSTSMPPGRCSLKMVPPALKGDDDAPRPSP